MFAQFPKKTLVSKLITGVVLISFILTNAPIRGAYANNDMLRGGAAFKSGDSSIVALLDSFHIDLHDRAEQVFASMPNKEVVKIHNYDKKKGGYSVAWVDKKKLEKLLARDKVGLIEDEDNPGQYIWAGKIDGAVVTKNGILLISERITYPTMADVPLDQLALPPYVKVAPLVYHFFKEYRADGEFAWISDVISKAKVVLVPSGSLGERHFTADKATKTIKIERDFLDYLMQGGQKRVGMGLFAEAAIVLSGKEIPSEKANEIVNRIAEVSLTGKNRLEDAIYLFNLIREISRKSRTEEARKLTGEERRYFLIDVMERNRGLDGRKAAQLLREAKITDKEILGYYGKITAAEAERDLRKIAEDHVLEVLIEQEKGKAPMFRLTGEHLADASLIEGRDIVSDYIVSARDTSLFGGKTAYTGEMQWLQGANTMPMFATAGRCFMDLVRYNNYTEDFFQYDRELTETLKTLEKEYKENIEKFKNDPKAQDNIKSEYVRKKKELVKDIANKFQSKLEWGVAKISPKLVKEIKLSLDKLAQSLGIPLYQLMLAIRSSAVGEDSETASFAGRQDTSLFVSYLKEVFKNMNITPEKYGYTWSDLQTKVFPWYDILNKVRQEVGEQKLNDAMYDGFIKEWLANQRSLFNERSIEYRLEKNIPIFTKKAAMSSLFQQMALTEYGFVAFSVNRVSGYPENQIEIIEGQINALVSGFATGDLVFVAHEGQKRLRRYKIPEDGRQTLHLPGIIFDSVTLKDKIPGGEMDKGGIFMMPFPQKLKGVPVTSDRVALNQLGKILTALSNSFGMYSDMEGGLVGRRDKEGKIMYVEDLSEPDGIAKDHLGRPRMQMIQFMTQIRPETVYNFKNPDIIELNYKQVAEESLRKARQEGKVLYEDPQAHTQGAVKGQIYILDKEHPETWHKAIGKIMATWQSDPDMNEIMKDALAVIAAVGGRNSHTMIVATEYGLIAISGIGNLDKLYDTRKVTIDAEAGVVLDGWDYELVEAGRSYNVREMGIIPISVGLNINSTQLAHKAAPFRNKPDFYGVGLGRLELFLADLIGAAGEGLLRYDAYKIYSLIEKLDKGEASQEEKMLLDKMLKYKGDTEHLKPNVNENNTISVFINGEKRVYKTGLEFFNAYIEDAQNPRYDPENPADLKLIKIFDEMTKGYLLGEERYVNLMAGGMKSIINALMVEPLELLEKAQSIQNTELRIKALDIVGEYKKTYEEADGVLSGNELLKITGELVKSYEGKVSKEDINFVNLIKQYLSRVFLFRLDDLKDDEYDKIPGSDKSKSRNPMAGYRGIGSFVDNPKVTRMQLRAIKKVVDLGARRDENGNFVSPGKARIGIFAPMVFDLEHVVKLGKICDEAGLTADRILRGVMTETPQIVELLPFLETIDFTSHGGNDMFQFTEEIDRNLAAKHFDTIKDRIIQMVRMLATIRNVTKKYNQEQRIPNGLKEITNGFCGNWPAVDVAGALTLYLLGFDSASVTIPSIDKATNTLFSLLDHLYGHNELLQLNLPEDKEVVVKDLYALIENPAKQEGLSKELIDMFPFLKLVLDNRNYNIYDQIDPDAKPDIKTDYAKGSISAFHLALPFHYQLLAEYDKGLKGDLFVNDDSKTLYEKISRLKIRRKKYDSEFDQVKKISSEGEDAEKELESLVTNIQECTKGIKDAEYELTSIALKGIIEEYLKRAGYDISQIDVGKRFYIDSLKQLWREQAKEAQLRGEVFIIETAKEPADYLKLKLAGERFELPKEPNPDLGNRGMKKILNPDKNIFRWDLQAIKELREEGLDNISLALSKLRDYPEIDETIALLDEAGLNDITLGMVGNSPNHIFALDYYFAKERKIKFLLLDREAMRELAEAKRGTEWDNINKELINDADVDKSLGPVTIPVIKTAAEEFGITLYLTENPKNEIPNVYAANKLFYADTKSRNNFSNGYNNVVGALKDLKDKDSGGKGALAIKAGLLFENAGSIATLKEIKGANAEFKVVIWAKNQVEFDKVMRIGGLADIIVIGLDTALEKLNEGYGIGFDRIMLISDRGDLEVAKAVSRAAGLRAMAIDMPDVAEGAIKSKEAKVNAMPIVFAKAIAHIFSSEDTVVNSYKDFIKLQSVKIANKEHYNKLLDLGGLISGIPLIKVAEETANLQTKYEIAVEEVEKAN
jgi:phosphoenolpyruvate synthase/pyruvate phosphate dikinase